MMYFIHCEALDADFTTEEEECPHCHSKRCVIGYVENVR